MHKFLLLPFLCLSFLSCKKNSINTIQDSFPGYYKVNRLTSNTAVDMNNDGVKSSDIYSEISRPTRTIDGQLTSFYNFESVINYAEVRPLYNQTSMSKLIAFNFPHQVIDYLSDSTPYLMSYKNEFLNYTYEFNGNNNIIVRSGNPEYTDQIGKINNLTLKDDGNLTVRLKKHVFDFVDKTWQEIEITAEYSKAQ